MKASIFCLPSVGSRAEIEAGMAATRPELYQRMLKELTELVKLADDLGYDSVSFTEHHFHIEGFEVSNNPVLLDLYRQSVSASVSLVSCCRPQTRSASQRISRCSII